MVDTKDYLAFAHRIADASGRVIRPYFGQAVDIETKADNSPVSIADREAEAAMREMIELTFPDHGIYGEEHGQSHVEKEFVWVIDPIDGTRAFLASDKQWGTLIALCIKGEPVFGILNQPITGERWVGTRGGVSYCSGNVLKTRAITKIADAEISTTSASYFTPAQGEAMVRLAKSARRVVKDGDCYAYGLLARGERDVVVDAGLKPYDILALVPIIEAAGGVITTWEGKPVTLKDSANVVAAGDKALHGAALALLQGA